MAARFSEVVHVAVAASLDEARDLLVRSLPLAPLVEPDPNAPPLTDQRRVRLWRRDGFFCRYCGKKTAPQCVLRAVSAIFPSDFPYHPNWKTGYTHPAYIELTSIVDHVVPAAHGGPDSDDNLVTCCWPCNAQKGEFTLERMGWSKLDVSTSDWDGLTNSYPTLWRAAAQRCQDRLSAGVGADEARRIRSYEKYGRRWLQLLA